MKPEFDKPEDWNKEEWVKYLEWYENALKRITLNRRELRALIKLLLSPDIKGRKDGEN